MRASASNNCVSNRFTAGAGAEAGPQILLEGDDLGAELLGPQLPAVQPDTRVLDELAASATLNSD
jgi:hypothetical protein